MKTAHEGLGVTEADWNQAVVLLTQTLDELEVPAQEKGEVLAAGVVAEERHRGEEVAVDG